MVHDCLPSSFLVVRVLERSATAERRGLQLIAKQPSLSAGWRPCVALSRKVGSSCCNLKTRALGHLLQFKDHRPQLSRCQLRGSTFKDDHILNNGSLDMLRRAGVRTDPRPPPSLSLSLAQPTRTSTERNTHRFPQVRFHAACWPSCARGRATAP